MAVKPKERLLVNALELFSLRGFHATGIDTILTQSKVAKTTMYRHFSSKEDLIVSALRKRDEDFRDWLMQTMNELNAQGAEKLFMIFDVHRQWAEGSNFNGCLFIKAASEFPDMDSPIHTLCVEHKKSMMRYIKELVEDSGITAPYDLVEQIMVLLDGATTSAQMNRQPRVFDCAKASARKLVS
ncbi:MAG: TetR family transcriptional regulator [Phormidesmis sp.]